MSAETQVATRKDIRDFLQSDTVKNQVAMALPRYITADRMLRICVTSINRNPSLAACSTESLLSSIMQAAQMGIEVDGRHGHLIPRWSSKKNCYEATFQPDYKGIVALVRRSPEVQDIYADVVCEHDVFKITKGLHRDLVHEIDIRADRGAIIGAYGVIQYRGGVSSFEFMARKEIETQHRDRSESWKAHVSKGYDTPWKTDEGEMYKKTAILRVSKLADISPDVYERLNADTEIPINDRVTEIPRPQIGGTAAPRLEEGKPSEPDEAAPDEKPVTAEKPASATIIELGKPTPRAGKKLPGRPKKESAPTPQPASEPEPSPTSDTRPQLSKLNEQLKAAGYTAEQLFAVAKENKWVDDDWRGLGDMPEDKLEVFNDDFVNALGELERVHGKPAAKSDSPFGE